MCWQQQGKSLTRERNTERGLEVDRTNGALYLRLAALSHKAHRTDEAEGFYRQWIDAQPKNAQAHVALAQFYFATGRLKEAEKSYQHAQEVDPSSRFAQEALITFYLDTNRMKEASVEIDSLLKAGPERYRCAHTTGTVGYSSRATLRRLSPATRGGA